MNIIFGSIILVGVFYTPTKIIEPKNKRVIKTLFVGRGDSKTIFVITAITAF